MQLEGSDIRAIVIVAGYSLNSNVSVDDLQNSICEETIRLINNELGDIGICEYNCVVGKLYQDLPMTQIAEHYGVELSRARKYFETCKSVTLLVLTDYVECSKSGKTTLYSIPLSLKARRFLNNMGIKNVESLTAMLTSEKGAQPLYFYADSERCYKESNIPQEILRAWREYTKLQEVDDCYNSSKAILLSMTSSEVIDKLAEGLATQSITLSNDTEVTKLALLHYLSSTATESTVVEFLDE